MRPAFRCRVQAGQDAFEFSRLSGSVSHGAQKSRGDLLCVCRGRVCRNVLEAVAQELFATKGEGADVGKIAQVRIRVSAHVKDQRGDEAQGLVVPVWIRRLIADEQPRQFFGIVDFVVRADGVERIEAVRVLKVCRIQHHDRAERAAVAGRDGEVLALGIRAHDRTGIVEQCGDNHAKAFAGAGSGKDLDDAIAREPEQAPPTAPSNNWPMVTEDAAPKHLPPVGPSCRAHGTFLTEVGIARQAKHPKQATPKGPDHQSGQSHQPPEPFEYQHDASLPNGFEHTQDRMREDRAAPLGQRVEVARKRFTLTHLDTNGLPQAIVVKVFPMNRRVQNAHRQNFGLCRTVSMRS